MMEELWGDYKEQSWSLWSTSERDLLKQFWGDPSEIIGHTNSGGMVARIDCRIRNKVLNSEI